MKGFPVATTTKVPINIGAGGDETEINFADFVDFFIVEDDSMVIYFFFFFQAEDGIRDHCVTGVQTCAFRSIPTAWIWTWRGPSSTPQFTKSDCQLSAIEN